MTCWTIVRHLPDGMVLAYNSTTGAGERIPVRLLGGGAVKVA